MARKVFSHLTTAQSGTIGFPGQNVLAVGLTGKIFRKKSRLPLDQRRNAHARRFAAAALGPRLPIVGHARRLRHRLHLLRGWKGQALDHSLEAIEQRADTSAARSPSASAMLRTCALGGRWGVRGLRRVRRAACARIRRRDHPAPDPRKARGAPARNTGAPGSQLAPRTCPTT